MLSRNLYEPIDGARITDATVCQNKGKFKWKDQAMLTPSSTDISLFETSCGTRIVLTSH